MVPRSCQTEIESSAGPRRHEHCEVYWALVTRENDQAIFEPDQIFALRLAYMHRREEFVAFVADFCGVPEFHPRVGHVFGLDQQVEG